jgi:hypothetical protein
MESTITSFPPKLCPPKISGFASFFEIGNIPEEPKDISVAPFLSGAYSVSVITTAIFFPTIFQ